MVSFLCIPMLSLFIIYQQVFSRANVSRYKTSQLVESHLKTNSCSCESVVIEQIEIMFFLCID